jgi:hypothetical protein
MTQLIDKDDFGQYIKFSDNIRAADVDFHCKDAQNFDAYPIMPLAVVSGNNIIDDIVTALAQSPVTRPELIAFYDDFLEPFLVCKAYARFLLWAGRNITQYGLSSNTSGDTFAEVTDKSRAELIADTEHKCNVYLARLTENLDDTDLTYDAIVYSFSNCGTKPRPKTRIKSI